MLKQTRIERRRPSDMFNLKEERLTSSVEVLRGYYAILERAQRSLQAIAPGQERGAVPPP
jgi:hypothetical protein